MTMILSTAFEPPHTPSGNLHDAHYKAYLKRVQARFDEAEKRGDLFETDAGPKLWEAYLSGFHPRVRQYHNCHCCRHFIERFGALVTIDENGQTRSAIWDLADAEGPEEAKAVANMLRTIAHAKVTGAFYNRARVWGTPQTGDWIHLFVLSSVTQRKSRGSVKSDYQLEAEKREDFQNVRRALHEFEISAIDQALGLLRSEALFRSEKVLGQAQWLHDVAHLVQAAPKALKDNVLWRFVAAAPAGFCHPRSSMIGTLLEDIQNGVSFEEAARKFRVKMDPLHYQRPQAAPTAGNVARAEKLFAELGLARSLERRFAQVEEIEALWRPAPAWKSAPGQSQGLFAHLLDNKHAGRLVAPPHTVTFAKFQRQVLPGAFSMEVLVPFVGPFFAMTTAVHDDAPPLLQWDREDRRNRFSLYSYAGGPTQATQWKLVQGWAQVTAITLRPEHWHSDMAHHAKGAFATIHGACDTRTGQGNAIFPETLRGELREVRATIEAYSKRAELRDREHGSACGLPAVGARFRVLDSLGNTAEYVIDRWD